MNNRNPLQCSRAVTRRPTLLIAIPAVFCGAPSFAQTVERASDIEGVSLEEVTVTATRHAESLSKVPISVSAFTQDQMDAQGVKQLWRISDFKPNSLAAMVSGFIGGGRYTRDETAVQGSTFLPTFASTATYFEPMRTEPR